MKSAEDITAEQRQAYANQKTQESRAVMGNYMTQMHTRELSPDSGKFGRLDYIAESILKMPKAATVFAEFTPNKGDKKKIVQAFGKAVYDEVVRDPKGFSLMDRFKDDGETGLQALMIKAIQGVGAV